MGETTKIVAANTSSSLRTTVPISIARQIGIKEGDQIYWELDKVDSRWVIIVSKREEIWPSN